MRLVEVFEHNNDSAIKRKIAALTAVIDDAAAFPNEKENAMLLRDKLIKQLTPIAIDSGITIEQRLIDVFQRNSEYYKDNGFNWIMFIGILKSSLKDTCTIISKSPVSGEYSISANYSTKTITIGYNQCYLKIPRFDNTFLTHFLGKLLFSDIRGILERF